MKTEFKPRSIWHQSCFQKFEKRNRILVILLQALKANSDSRYVVKVILKKKKNWHSSNKTLKRYFSGKGCKDVSKFEKMLSTWILVLMFQSSPNLKVIRSLISAANVE